MVGELILKKEATSSDKNSLLKPKNEPRSEGGLVKKLSTTNGKTSEKSSNLEQQAGDQFKIPKIKKEKLIEKPRPANADLSIKKEASANEQSLCKAEAVSSDSKIVQNTGESHGKVSFTLLILLKLATV